MKKLLLTTAMIGALMSSAQAVELNGHALLKECTLRQMQFCQGFALGIADNPTIKNCHPNGLMGAQFSGVVLGYLRQHPERLHLRGEQLVNEAYANAWPCKNQFAENEKPQQAPPSSDDEIFRDTTEMDVMVATGIAITMAYVRCGGNITPEQKEAVKTQLEERGELIAFFSNKFKSSKCSEISAAYRTFIAGVTSLGPKS